MRYTAKRKSSVKCDAESKGICEAKALIEVSLTTFSGGALDSHLSECIASLTAGIDGAFDWNEGADLKYEIKRISAKIRTISQYLKSRAI